MRWCGKTWYSHQQALREPASALRYTYILLLLLLLLNYFYWKNYTRRDCFYYLFVSILFCSLLADVFFLIGRFPVLCLSLASRLLSLHISDNELNWTESYFNIFYGDGTIAFSCFTHSPQPVISIWEIRIVQILNVKCSEMTPQVSFLSEVYMFLAIGCYKKLCYYEHCPSS
jgi:hypothetical protein